jgi:septum formation protein
VTARRVILASRSPRRRELMKLLGVDFEVIPPPADVGESGPSGDPKLLVQLRAHEKAVSVCTQASNAVVVGADTIVCVAGEAFGKPKDRDDARRMLKVLSGRTHEVLSGVAVAASDGDTCAQTDVGSARVTFRDLTDIEIEAYVGTGEPLDKAGAYGIQGAASVFVESVEGDYFSVVGLPVSRLVRLLRDTGVRILGEPLES